MSKKVGGKQAFHAAWGCGPERNGAVWAGGIVSMVYTVDWIAETYKPGWIAIQYYQPAEDSVLDAERVVRILNDLSTKFPAVKFSIEHNQPKEDNEAVSDDVHTTEPEDTNEVQGVPA